MGTQFKNTQDWMRRAIICHRPNAVRSNGTHTRLDGKRLNCWAMKHFSHSARFLVVAVTMVLLAGIPLLAQSSDSQDNRRSSPQMRPAWPITTV